MPPEENPTWEALKAKVQELVLAEGEFAGAPIPIYDRRMVLAKGHRKAEQWDQGTLGSSPETLALLERRGERAEAEETGTVRNQWWSPRLRSEIFIVWHGSPGEEGFRVELVYDPWASRLEYLYRWRMQLDTLDAGMQAWSWEGESRAILTLSSLVTIPQFQCYVSTGMFVEQSKRSQAVYVFRRCRPTLVLLPDRDGNLHPSCALCLHPLAYYERTYAGAMVPTDDIVAHLLWMRGDEAGFWRKANSHPPDRLEAGI